ncbi:MAG: hypothetical protein CM15mV128_240 [Caudoviricetes sp.]|nr:MAG: hypothetical protein CM15mV128_240 [Caudoviricetes sp.]
MKVLDPTSVVREGEQATAANAAGVPSRVRNAFNKALTGEKLSLEQRKDFVSTAIKLFQTNQKLWINLDHHLILLLMKEK